MAQDDGYFYCGFRFLSHEANGELQALRANYEVRLIETRHEIEQDGWVLSESRRVISHAAQIRLVDVLVEMVETLYERAAKAYFSAVGSSEYKERVDSVEEQLLSYSLVRWAQLTRDLPLEPISFDPVTETVLGSNENLLSTTLAAHLRSKALRLELQRWRTEVATQSATNSRSEPAESRTEAGDLNGSGERTMGEENLLKFFDPEYLRQMGTRFPELASVLPGAAEAATFVRTMEAAKAKAEVAFRQRETAEKWNELNLDTEDPEAAVDRFGEFGTEYPWRLAGCEYAWEIASTFLRTFYANCKPDAFETLAKLVIDEHAAKVYDEKLKSYERTFWINYDTAKAEFQDYVRKRLDSLVRAECLDRWQKQSTAPPTVGAEKAANETAADQRTNRGHGLPERYTRLFDYIAKKLGSSSEGGFSTAFRRAEARRLEAERELRKSLVQQLSDGSDQNLESLCPLDFLVHFRSYAERSFEAIGAECVELFRDVDAFQSFLYVVMEWVTKGILPTPSTPQETIDRLMALADHTAELIERTGTRDLMGGDWIAALDDARENLRRASVQGTDLDAEAVSSEEPNIRLRESLSAFRQRIGEHDPDTLLLMGGDWERVIDVVLADLIRTEADCTVTFSGKSFLVALRNEANRDSAEQFLMVALEQLNGVLVASWWEESAASPLGHPEGTDRTESAHTAGVNRPAVVLGTAGLPHGRPAESVFAANPKIRQLVETHPKIVPHVNLIAQFQQAQAEAEVAFRQRELTENWAEWSGPYPWAEEKDPDTTDCPWWVAGAEYVFHLAAAWRKHSPGNKENVERLLPKQVASLASWFYNNRLLAHDIVEGKNAYADDLLGGGNARRFSNVAFLFTMRKFAESDLGDWKGHAAVLAGALIDLESRSGNRSVSPELCTRTADRVRPETQRTIW